MNKHTIREELDNLTMEINELEEKLESQQKNFRKTEVLIQHKLTLLHFYRLMELGIIPYTKRERSRSHSPGISRTKIKKSNLKYGTRNN